MGEVSWYLYRWGKMYGRLTGLAARIKRKSRLNLKTHCVIHQSDLASKDMTENLKTVLTGAVKFIRLKAISLNSQLFMILLCNDMGM